ncbi:GNAT family N-acetyltransferase [Paenibacillus sp. FSL F4-0125]|uniref:GNAT family N-acetyltransferase n=1 Tax=Paenibacillus sp. FSL F4-0125 TaxID=2954730 RepID=UPI0030F93DDA
MKFNFRPYRSEDLLKVRDFLIHSYSKLKGPNTWLIDRWEFVIYFQETQGGTLNQWERNVGLWEYDDGELAAVVCMDDGFYFQCAEKNPPESLLDDMFSFAEQRVGDENEGFVQLYVPIPEFMSSAAAVANKRGYSLTKKRESVNSLQLDKEFPVALPSGFRICSGDEIDVTSKALGHIMAFDYADTPEAELTLQHYGNIRKAPSYNSHLDLSIVNEAGEVVSFCNIFWDSVNGIGILEPVGTSIRYRSLGLGRAVLHEGFNRLRELGAIKVYVGSMQPFYEKLGFNTEVWLQVWEYSGYINEAVRDDLNTGNVSSK